MSSTIGTTCPVSSNPTADGLGYNKRSDEAKNTAQALHGVVQTTTAAAQEKLGDLKETATEYLKLGKEKAENIGISIQDSIRANPFKSILIAAGVGLVLGVTVCVTSSHCKS